MFSGLFWWSLDTFIYVEAILERKRSLLAKYAVTQRFWFEQASRTREVLDKLSKQYGVPVPDGCHSILEYMNDVDHGHDPRRKNAVWHISCHTDEDRQRVQTAMKELRIKNYNLYATINDCIADFAV